MAHNLYIQYKTFLNKVFLWFWRGTREDTLSISRFAITVPTYTRIAPVYTCFIPATLKQLNQPPNHNKLPNDL
ncbi:hypothetical protein ABIB50_000093 [Mucilaginibacter sp. UYCu711]